MDSVIKDNLIASYQVDGGFIVHDRAMLERLYALLEIDPKTSLDWRIYDLEGLTHFFQHGVVSLVKKLAITKDDYVLSPGEGNGAPSRLIVKMAGCHVVGVDINPDQIIKARELADLHGIQDKVTYYQQDVEEMSLEKKDFTKAYCNETCGHWQDKGEAFRRIYAHLIPGAMMGLNIWLKGDKGSLNDAFGLLPDFRPLYKQGIWFQDDLATYHRLLEGVGFKVLEVYDCTDKVDIKMRARIKASLQWERYEKVMWNQSKESALRYYNVMLKTHYDFLRYGVIIAEK
jgi:cyclopropane fatty-acyl-phospholipid synthase-like methyltransferase